MSLAIIYDSGIILKNNLNSDVLVFSHNEIVENEKLYKIYLNNGDNVTNLDLGSLYFYNNLIYILLLLLMSVSIVITIKMQLKKKKIDNLLKQ